MGLFSTIFGIGKKIAQPLANLGKRMWSGLSNIGQKIGNWWRGAPKGYGKFPTDQTERVRALLTRQNPQSVVETLPVGGKVQGFKYLPPRQYDPTSLFN